MKVVVRNNTGLVVNQQLDEMTLKQQYDFHHKLGKCEVSEYALKLKKGVTLENIQSLGNLKPNMVEVLDIKLRNQKQQR